jgi:hypothetical protein
MHRRKVLMIDSNLGLDPRQIVSEDALRPVGWARAVDGNWTLPEAVAWIISRDLSDLDAVCKSLPPDNKKIDRAAELLGRSRRLRKVVRNVILAKAKKDLVRGKFLRRNYRRRLALIDKTIDDTCRELFAELEAGALKAEGALSAGGLKQSIKPADIPRFSARRSFLESRIRSYHDVTVRHADMLQRWPERGKPPVAELPEPEVASQDVGESPRARAKRHEREARAYLDARSRAAAGSNELLPGADSMWREIPGGRGEKISRPKFRKLHKDTRAAGVQVRGPGRP